MSFLKQRFKVIQPLHPLYSREFEVVEGTRKLGREWITFYEGDGRLLLIPVTWTDLSYEEDHFAEVSRGRSYFRIEDLIRLVELMQVRER